MINDPSKKLRQIAQLPDRKKPSNLTDQEEMKELARQIDTLSSTVESLYKRYQALEGRTGAGVDVTRKKSEQEALFLEPEQYQKITESVGKSEFIKEQQKGLEDLIQLSLAQRQLEPQLNLQPLMQLADFWAGTNIAQGYRQPEPLEQMAARGFDIAERIQKRREALSAQIEDLIKAHKAGTAMGQLITSLGAKQQEPPLFAHDRDIRYLQNLSNEVEKYVPLVAAYKNVLDAIETHMGFHISDWEKHGRPPIPGLGMTGFMADKLGAVGRFFLSEAGAAINLVWNKLLTDHLYAKSGSQINEQEQKRLRAALGDSLRPETAIIGLRNLGREIAKIIEEKEAVYRVKMPHILHLYETGRGISSKKVLDLVEGTGRASTIVPKKEDKRVERQELRKRTTEQLNQINERIKALETKK